MAYEQKRSAAKVNDTQTPVTPMTGMAVTLNATLMSVCQSVSLSCDVVQSVRRSAEPMARADCWQSGNTSMGHLLRI